MKRRARVYLTPLQKLKKRAPRLYRMHDGHLCKHRGCRKARPLCAARARESGRERYQQCTCEGYGFPHRKGSGRCFHHPEGNVRFHAWLMGVSVAEMRAQWFG